MPPYAHLLLLLQSFSAVARGILVTVKSFNKKKASAKSFSQEFDVTRIRPRLGGLPHLGKT